MLCLGLLRFLETVIANAISPGVHTCNPALAGGF
jgi:hypothetical protein